MHFRLTSAVYAEIARTIGARPAENGGALGWFEGDNIIRHFQFDDTAQKSGATYSPDHERLNKMFRDEWNPRGIRLAGFVHSHPSKFVRPSSGDLYYAQRILDAIPDLPQLFLPIVQTEPDTGKFELVPFVVTRKGSAVITQRIDLEVLDTPAAGGDEKTAPSAPSAAAVALSAAVAPVALTAAATDKAEAVADEAGGGQSPEAADTQRPGVFPGETFARVTAAYDLARMATARVVAVGTGGAASFVEDLARCGLGDVVLIDVDTVSETNLATQQVYRADLGRPKVAALADRLRDINPAIRVRAVCKSLDDLDDADVASLCRDSSEGPPPAVTLLCGLTDSFTAQARVNALALNLGLPSLCAQVYKEGRAAEITFTYPGLTPACHRCILSSRYNSYLSGGYVNNVTSDGTPIFATSRLNATKGFVALALLHHSGSTPEEFSSRFAGLATRMGDRNLVQIRMDPDLAETLKIRTFNRVFGESNTSLLFDETVWRPQAAVPRCLDCGGSGDLRKAIGTFDDTRKIRVAER